MFQLGSVLVAFITLSANASELSVLRSSMFAFDSSGTLEEVRSVDNDASTKLLLSIKGEFDAEKSLVINKNGVVKVPKSAYKNRYVSGFAPSLSEINFAVNSPKKINIDGRNFDLLYKSTSKITDGGYYEITIRDWTGTATVKEDSSFTMNPLRVKIEQFNENGKSIGVLKLMGTPSVRSSATRGADYDVVD